MENGTYGLLQPAESSAGTRSGKQPVQRKIGMREIRKAGLCWREAERPGAGMALTAAAVLPRCGSQPGFVKMRAAAAGDGEEALLEAGGEGAAEGRCCPFSAVSW